MDSRTRLLTRADPLRARVENMMVEKFRDEHGAEIKVKAPEIVAIFDRNQNPIAAAGVQTSKTGFFSQSYLDEDVGDLITKRTHEHTSAADIIELVNVVSVRPIVLMKLIDAVVALGRSRGKSWGLFTASEAIQGLLKHSQKQFLVLGAASADKVPDLPRWGRYYETSPAVCALKDCGGKAMVFNPRELKKENQGERIESRI